MEGYVVYDLYVRLGSSWIATVFPAPVGTTAEDIAERAMQSTSWDDADEVTAIHPQDVTDWATATR